MNHADRISSDNLNILLVDDEEIVLNATREYLTRYYSFQVDIAESVEQALDKISAGTYDVIIADYEMEKMSGLDLLSAIRQRGDQTPFIVFTGKGREEVVIASFELGADGYVQKGGEIRAQFAELAQKVRTVVQGKRAASALRDQNERYRILFETMEQGVIYQDHEGRVIEANPAAAAILNIPLHELMGSILHDGRLQFFTEQKTRLVPDEQPFLQTLYTGKSQSTILGITHPPGDDVT
ncbi:response regulator, partial [Methanospirillum sp.]